MSDPQLPKAETKYLTGNRIVRGLNYVKRHYRLRGETIIYENKEKKEKK